MLKLEQQTADSTTVLLTKSNFDPFFTNLRFQQIGNRLMAVVRAIFSQGGWLHTKRLGDV
jgi:hypothetical protein